MNIQKQLTPGQLEALDFHLERINATAQRQHDADQSGKPEKERAPFVPVTREAHVSEIIDRALANYATARLEAVRKHPENVALIDAILSADPATREAIRGQLTGTTIVRSETPPPQPPAVARKSE